jgi:N-acetylneuraminic acid mutarotase
LLALPAAAQNTWTAKALLPSPGRETAVAFAVNGKGYLVGGWNSPTQVYNDTWEYDPGTNTWAQKADLPVPTVGRHNAVGLAIASQGYVGTGRDRANVRQNDWWAFNPALNQWTRKADVPGGVRANGFGFGLGNRGYVGGGYSGTREQPDFHAYDPATDTWTACAPFPGAARTYVGTFTLSTAQGNTGYTVGGYNGFTLLPSTETWAYNPSTDTWTQRAALPAGRFTMVAWGLGSRGYAGSGLTNSSGNPLADYWAYDPAADTWTAVATLGGGAKGWATGFTLNGKGYLLSGTGPSGTAAPSSELWEYSPAVLATQVRVADAHSSWPNPTTGLLQLTRPAAGSLRVYSGNGQLLKTLPLRPGPNTIDLSSLPNGSYVLKTGSLVRRVVVQH